jgi:predicted enzyme related to lactoylglutathione lyase
MNALRVFHLELHTHDLEAASAFCYALLHWRAEQIDSPLGSHYALLLGDGLDGGIVACGTKRAGWLPYVEVDQIDRARHLARRYCWARVRGRPAGAPVVSTPLR